MKNNLFRSLAVTLLVTSFTGAAVAGPANAGTDSPLSISTASAATTLSTPSAPSAPRLVSAGYTGAELSWASYSGANRYEVRYATKADFSNAKIIEKVNSRYLGDLADGTYYYVQYRALVPVKGAPYGTYSRSPWSASIKLLTQAHYPGAFTTLKATPAMDSIKVTWNPTANTTHYTVVVADNMAMTLRKRTYSNIKGTSYTIKNLTHNARSSMPSFVRVYAHNKTYKTRTSARLTAYPAAPKVVGTETITVASQNLLCPSCKISGAAVAVPHWNKRVLIHMKNFTAKKADVVLMQEALNMNIPGTTTKAMADLQVRLKKAGYNLDRTPEKAGTAHYVNRVAYKSSKYSLVKRGTFALPVAKGEGKRGAAWVLLKSKATGKHFYAVSFHVSPKLPLTGKVSKTSTMALINSKMNAINTQKYPVMLGGDMNSSFYGLPSNVPHETMIKAGWTDSASAVKKTNYLYATTNGYKKSMKQTFGRIDYILTKNISGTVSYQNVMDITSGGVFRSVPGSDHNMVVAQFKLR